jgi:hypothetical protein
MLRIVGLAFCAPLLLAGNCPMDPPPPPPPPPGDTILLQSTVAPTGGACGITVTPCTGATGVFIDTFNPTAVGPVVTATAVGATTTSRPQIQIRTILGVQVANSGATPTTNTAMASFSPTSTGLHFIVVCNCGGAGPPAPTYTIQVSQAP